MTFDDFAALVDLVFSSKFTMPVAEKRLGKVKTWISEGRGEVADIDPELHNTMIEISVPELKGRAMIATYTPIVHAVHTQPTKPLPAPWDRLTKACGPATPGEPVLDAVNGPKPFSFTRRVAGAEGKILLSIDMKKSPPEIVDINLYRHPSR